MRLQRIAQCGGLCLTTILWASSGNAQTTELQATVAQTANSQPASQTGEQTPLTPRERELLQRIQELETRLKAVESKVATTTPAETSSSSAGQTNTAASTLDVESQTPQTGSSQTDSPQTIDSQSQTTQTSDPQSSQPQDAGAQEQKPAGWKTAHETEMWGGYDPGRGFKVAKTEIGDLSISAYSLIRWINQLPAHQTFIDHNGSVQTVDPRNDIQFHRVQIFFKGFMFSPKFTYMVNVWSVNSTGQVAVVGSLTYHFSKRFNLSGGVNGLPGTRTLQGSHPYWLGSDRVMADEFFRPGFTSGIWATGEMFPRLFYSAMVGNNLSQLGINAAQLTRDLAGAGSVWWMPTTGEFGPRGAYGDYEWHPKLATRFGASYTYSREDRFSDANFGPDNTQIRLADSLLFFGTGSLAPGVTVQRTNFYLLAVDAGIKTHGFFLQGEGYSRLLDHFQADGPVPFATIRDHGFYVQAAQMVVPKLVEVYGATSWIYGDSRWNFKTSHEWIGGTNYYPAKTRNLRMNAQLIRVFDSPVSSTFGYYVGGQSGTTLSVGTNLLF